ncbi:DNA topoisomerase IB [Salinimonas sediminis]|uniref:DNA topoisomerase n=1 Tax=Salinimonas sediminis TaxID=2303538 RepID=A0A346NLP3_9ALTE|nr:DNA topoisomerase IB [Salinimonas sediminis]AXR06450.1 DNA topoisomerase IB [Salinimonas sediminis]
MAQPERNIRRVRRGKGFEYFYPSGRKISGQRVIQRIAKLGIPPRWQDVRIAQDKDADLQATGYDMKGRKQYIYHTEWHARQQQAKFSRLAEFGQALPAFREYCWSHVNQQKWREDKTLALVCLLLDHTGLRAGNRQYTTQNNTHGLTTLRRKHVQHDDSATRLSFIGKHNKPRDVEIDDPRLAELVAQSAEAQGYALFRYEDGQGQWHDVDSDDVNSFIHQHLGEAFSCKDFRTWGASRFGLFSLPDVDLIVRENSRRSWPATLTSHVAKMLGNTPAVCRQYYLHPQLVKLVENDQPRVKTIDEVRRIVEKQGLSDASVSATEKLLHSIIKI